MLNTLTFDSPAFLFDCGHSGQDRFVQAELLDDGYRCGLGTGAQNRIVLGDFQLAAAGQMSPGLQRDEGWVFFGGWG
ncbi:hypothetical protein CesoFtcFv8_012212 [Champsocephalus esox]|uniref:Uncharacterized protein n=1 Tax=Champsocephalus esox TaxID=159716 RepID=A0AAN8GTS3_9TELE|nr:hypothetical protein CesoFtcFv8_012212 [Champsocephalus esox]